MKQAIMVIGNKKFDILQQTIDVLDDADINFIVYFNKNTKEPKLNSKYSKIEFVKGNKVKWGHFSEIQAELKLIKAALKGNYEYYHLINGNDFPLMDKNYFKNYFSNKPIKLGFLEYLEKCEYWKFQHYYPLKNINLQKNISSGIYGKIVNLFGVMLNIHKIDNDNDIEEGFPYFSLPKKYVEKIVNYKKTKLFKNTLDGQEFFNQMILRDLKPSDLTVSNSIYSRKYRMMKSAEQASRLANYVKVDNFNWFYLPEYEFKENDFGYLRKQINKDLAFIHTIKPGENPLRIFK